MIVYGPTHVFYDFDLGPIIMHDYFHKGYQALVANTVGSDVSLPNLWMNASLIRALAPYCFTYTVGQHIDRGQRKQILRTWRTGISM